MAKQEKLKQYEIQALSHKVFNEVTKLKLAKTKELYSKEIQEYVKEYKSLDLAKEVIREQQEELHSKFKKKFKLGYISASSCEENLIKEIAKFPNQNSIEQEIILKGIFSDKSELEEFIKELVKKFS